MKTIILILLIIATQSLFAESQTRGNWTYEAAMTEDDVFVVTAKTVSDSGAVLGVICTSTLEGCYSFFNPATTSCKPESEFVILLNAADGAKAISTTCYALAEERVFFFDIAERVKMKSNDKLGIVIPMDSGRFKAYYFSLKGSSIIINLLEAKWLNFKKTTGHKDGTI